MVVFIDIFKFRRGFNIQVVDNVDTFLRIEKYIRYYFFFRGKNWLKIYNVNFIEVENYYFYFLGKYDI